MTDSGAGGLQSYLESGRRLLQTASETYERPLSPTEYWWLGVGLAASTLADLSGRSYAIGRVEQLIHRVGYKGVRGDWLQRFVEELAELDAEGLLWPVYERSTEGHVVETGVSVHPGFDAEAAYFLALGHIAVAASLQNGNESAVPALAESIVGLIESGLTEEHESRILAALQPPDNQEAEDQA